MNLAKVLFDLISNINLMHLFKAFNPNLQLDNLCIFNNTVLTPKLFLNNELYD